MSTEKTVSNLRAHLFAQLEALRGAADPTVEIERAKAVSDIAQTIINTAKVEIEYLRVNGGGDSSFIDGAVGEKNLPNGITGIVRHRIAG